MAVSTHCAETESEIARAANTAAANERMMFSRRGYVRGWMASVGQGRFYSLLDTVQTLPTRRPHLLQASIITFLDIDRRTCKVRSRSPGSEAVARSALLFHGYHSICLRDGLEPSCKKSRNVSGQRMSVLNASVSSFDSSVP